MTVYILMEAEEYAPEHRITSATDLNGSRGALEAIARDRVRRLDGVKERTISVAEQEADMARGTVSTSSGLPLRPIHIKRQPKRVDLDFWHCWLIRVEPDAEIAESYLQLTDLGDWEYRFEWTEWE